MNNTDIEIDILQNLMSNTDYAAAVLPFIKSEYFTDYKEQTVFKVISDYVENYGQSPGKNIAVIELDNSNADDDTIAYFTKTFVNDEKTNNKKWLIEKTEEFCQNSALHIALRESIKIAQDESNLSKSAIPDILKDAIAVSFDQNIGHLYLGNESSRYEHYHEEEEVMPFSLDVFNDITNNGLPRKVMMVMLGGPGVGKSLFLTNFASDFMLSGKNVLYITMEMSETRIAERIDSNLLDIDISKLSLVQKSEYFPKINEIRKKTTGNIVIKEYPTASAHAGHFRFLLNELDAKKGFTPDILIVDYLNICASSRYNGKDSNSYSTVKAIAEELRGLAIEFNLSLITATQTTRGGYRASDVELTDISESFGTAAVSDYVVAIIDSEEFQQQGVIGVKPIKNRYGTIGKLHKLNILKNKMRLSNRTTDMQTGEVITDETYADYDQNLGFNETPSTKFIKPTSIDDDDSPWSFKS